MIPIPDLTPIFKLAAGVFCIMAPLSIWKLIEIVIWLLHHISIHWTR